MIVWWASFFCYFFEGERARVLRSLRHLVTSRERMLASAGEIAPELRPMGRRSSPLEAGGLMRIEVELRAKNTRSRGNHAEEPQRGVRETRFVAVGKSIRWRKRSPHSASQAR